jgi:hypothetical protein
VVIPGLVFLIARFLLGQWLPYRSPFYGAADGPQHTHFDFSDLGIAAQVLYIVFDSQNVDPDDVGITNI